MDNLDNPNNSQNPKNPNAIENNILNILELKGISMIYGAGGEVKALQNIDLTVVQGEWLAIMGPSGSGKTTMMNIIGCMDKPTGGTVILDGQDITKLSSRALTSIR
jgi:putative ABC transport system ATP-binding protein